jgi:ubiquinone/menaquinone biosynthesis C-methylase UbiE
MTAQAPPTTGQIRQVWDAIAHRYDKFVTDEDMPFADQVLDRVEVGPGTRFLDVACGSGAVAIPAARRGAAVTGVDLSPTMVDRLIARARAEGLANLAGQVMNAEALDLPDDTFDVAASQNGVSLLPDLAAGLWEMTRVTKPGGTVTIVAFGPLQKAEFLGFFLRALQAVVPDTPLPPTDPLPLPMQLANPAVFRQKLTDAGLAHLRIETTSWDMRFTSGRHFWDVVTASDPIAVQLTASLTDQQRVEVQQVLDGMLRERAGGAAKAVLRNDMNIAIGVKPPVDRRDRH